MKRHPFANDIRFRYWLINEEIKQRADKVELKIVLTNYLELLTTIELSQSESFKEYLSEIRRDLHGIRSDIT